MTGKEFLQAFGEIDARHVRSAGVFYRRGPAWRSIMKKTTKLALSAAAVVLVAGIIFGAWYLQNHYGVAPGSAGEKKPLRIVVDGISHYNLEQQLPRIKGNGFIAEYEIEYLPQKEYYSMTDVQGNSEDRDMALTRLRTQIMAGNGPDVYLCAIPTARDQANHGVKALFPYPEKAALSGSFLPLDEYLESAEYMEWDNFEKTVTDAGKNRLGQCILPMNYTYHVTLFNKDELSQTEYPAMTYGQMLESGDPVLLAAAVEDANYFYLGDSFGAYADYQNDALTFTEEELFRRLCDSFSLFHESGMILGEENTINSCFNTPLHSSLYFGFPNMWYCTERESPTWDNTTVENPVNLREERSALIIPLYNDQGGVTANITAWAAVDAHTEHPEEAFHFLDALFSTPVMQSALFGANYGVCVNNSLGTKWKQAAGGAVADSMWYASDGNLEEIEKVRAQINQVKFYTPLDGELDALTSALVLTAYGKEESEAARRLVHETYYTMQKMLGES